MIRISLSVLLLFLGQAWGLVPVPGLLKLTSALFHEISILKQQLYLLKKQVHDVEYRSHYSHFMAHSVDLPSSLDALLPQINAKERYGDFYKQYAKSHTYYSHIVFNGAWLYLLSGKS